MPPLQDTVPAPVAVVLDTNAALDWLVFRDHRIAPLAQAIEQRQATWLATATMRRELAEVIRRPKLAQRQADSERPLTMFDVLAQHRHEPPPAPPGLLCTDPADQVFLDLAAAEKARWLITRDKALLALRRRALAHGLFIAPPEAWRAD